MTAVTILSAIISLETTQMYVFGVYTYIYKAKKHISAIADIAMDTILQICGSDFLKSQGRWFEPLSKRLFYSTVFQL